MKTDWLHRVILRAASLLVPGEQRDEWVREWHSELWYIPQHGATLFCLGAFQDALWLRRNLPAEEDPGFSKRSGIHLTSPLRCLAWLAALAAVSMFIAFHMHQPGHIGMASHFRIRDLLAGCFAMSLLTCPYLAATRLAMEAGSANRSPLPWRSDFGWGSFLP